MNNYYGYEKWKQWNNDQFGVYTAIDAAYFLAELNRAGIEVIEGIELLEIGFGNGAFASFVASNGCNYIGSEINQILLERAHSFGLNVFDGSIIKVLDILNPETLDAVVAFDVLEHLTIENIQLFLKDARLLLKPGGVFIARIPSGDSPFGRAIYHGDITHQSSLGSSAIWQLANQTGFKVRTIGEPCLPIFGFGVRRALRRVTIKIVQKAVTWFINSVFHGRRPRIITANLVFVLTKPLIKASDYPKVQIS